MSKGLETRRACLDFTLLLLLALRAYEPQRLAWMAEVRHGHVAPKKKRKRLAGDDFAEAVEALTAPSGEDLLLDEAFEVLVAVDPDSRRGPYGGGTRVGPGSLDVFRSGQLAVR